MTLSLWRLLCCKVYSVWMLTVIGPWLPRQRFHGMLLLLTCGFMTKCSLERRQTLWGLLLVKDLVMCDPLLLISHVVQATNSRFPILRQKVVQCSDLTIFKFKECISHYYYKCSMKEEHKYQDNQTNKKKEEEKQKQNRLIHWHRWLDHHCHTGQ